MNKDKEWLKGEVKKRAVGGEDDFTFGMVKGLDIALGLIDQLDEPEPLSQEWIEENQVIINASMGALVRNYDFGVPSHKLQNLLVPKQEKTYDEGYHHGYQNAVKDIKELLRR